MGVYLNGANHLHHIIHIIGCGFIYKKYIYKSFPILINFQLMKEFQLIADKAEIIHGTHDRYGEDSSCCMLDMPQHLSAF